jgi:hypothetical protein
LPREREAASRGKEAREGMLASFVRNKVAIS